MVKYLRLTVNRTSKAKKVWRKTSDIKPWEQKILDCVKLEVVKTIIR